MTDYTTKILVDELDEADAQGLAAADLAGQVMRLLHEALDLSDLDQKALAARLGVTEGRVSQVVNGDGNMRIAAVGRYLRALGYEARLTATPLREGAPVLPRELRRRPRWRSDAESQPDHAQEPRPATGSKQTAQWIFYLSKFAGSHGDSRVDWSPLLHHFDEIKVNDLHLAKLRDFHEAKEKSAVVHDLGQYKTRTTRRAANESRYSARLRDRTRAMTVNG